MKELKYKKIPSIEQYNEYCNIHEELVTADYEKFIDEIELLEILIEEYDNRIQKQCYVKLDPVELLKSLLKDSPLNQTQFAKEIHISRQLISDILNYRRNISQEVASKLAAFFAMKQEAFSRAYELQPKETLINVAIVDIAKPKVLKVKKATQKQSRQSS